MPSQTPPDDYASFARFYDPVTGPLLRGVRLRVAALARDLGARCALDICCGTGAQLTFLHRTGLSCTGADLSGPMLDVARAKTSGDINYLRCDARHLPLADSCFDLTVLSFALHEKPPALRTAMLTEALRVTKPGGALAVADYARPRGLSRRLGLSTASLVEWAAGKEHYALFRDFLTAGGVSGLLKRSGLTFEVVERSHLGAVMLVAVTA